MRGGARFFFVGLRVLSPTVLLVIKIVRTYLCGHYDESVDFSEWSSVFGNAEMTTALSDRFTYCCYIVETGNESYRLQHNTMAANFTIFPSHDKVTLKLKRSVGSPAICYTYQQMLL